VTSWVISEERGLRLGRTWGWDGTVKVEGTARDPRTARASQPHEGQRRVSESTFVQYEGVGGR
jgi:hypothetical protein